MSGYTFGQIGKLFTERVGEGASSQREKWIHLTEGYRRVASQLDIPELTQPDARATIPVDPSDATKYLDYVEVDCDLYAIRSIFNVTAGHIMHLEEGDARGRDRYLNTDAMPPEGEVVRAVRVGNRIYVRDRPSEETTLKIVFKVQVPDLDSSYEDKHPLVPAQYHMSIFHEAVASYFSVHPPKNEGGFDSYAPIREHKALAQQGIGQAEDPQAIEANAKWGRFRLAGFRFGSRR